MAAKQFQKYVQIHGQRKGVHKGEKVRVGDQLKIEDLEQSGPNTCTGIPMQTTDQAQSKEGETVNIRVRESPFLRAEPSLKGERTLSSRHDLVVGMTYSTRSNKT